VRLSLGLLAVSMAGMVAGAALIGLWAVGLAVIAGSMALAVFALLREPESRPAPSVSELPTLAQVLERNRAS
jgi:hypothetical protein